MNEYTRCLRAQKERYEASRLGAVPVKAVVVERGAQLHLKCFECLHPQELQNIEEAWKPTESFFTQKAAKIFKKVRNRLLLSFGVVSRQTKVWEYQWERANLTEGDDARWHPVIDMRKPGTVVDFMTQFLKKRTRSEIFSLGDHFELSIAQMSAKWMGFYRCIRHSHQLHVVSTLYFVDVVTSLQPRIVFLTNASQSRVPADMSHLFRELHLQSYGRVSEWSACSRCGRMGGESRRTIACTVKVTSGTSTEYLSNSNKVSFMLFFDDIPCRSSLLPLIARSRLWKVQDVLEVRRCYSRCQNDTVEGTRIIEGINAFGRRAVVDVVPPGEYRISENRPLLRKPVLRRTVRVFEKDSYKLSCGDASQGVQWLHDEKYVSSELLLQLYPDHRIYINSQNHLVITHLKLKDDESFFSCHTPRGEVIRTFSLTVNRAKQQHELMDYISYAVRFGVFLFIMVLVITVVLNTSAHAEKCRRDLAIQKFEEDNARKAEQLPAA